MQTQSDRLGVRVAPKNAIGVGQVRLALGGSFGVGEVLLALGELINELISGLNMYK